MQHGQRAAIPICKLLDQLLDHLVDQSNDRLPNRDPDHFSDLEIEFKRSKLVLLRQSFLAFLGSENRYCPSLWEFRLMHPG